MAADRPVGGADYPRSRQEFDDWFPDDAACIEYLAALRWPAGFVCPNCGDDRSWRTSALSFLCAGCGRKTSVTAGTIFHRSHAPLSTWFAAIWYVTSARNGVSARGLQGALNLGSYETAWAWLQKLRRAMVRPGHDLLAGTVELGETLIDSSGRIPVLVAVERLSRQRLGRVRLGVADQGRDPLVFATETIALGSTIRGIADEHRFARVGYLAEASAAPGAQFVGSGLRRWLAGTLGQRVSRQHLPYYLDEFAFRFDRRGATARGLLFYRLLQQAVTTAPHPRTELGNGHRG